MKTRILLLVLLLIPAISHAAPQYCEFLPWLPECQVDNADAELDAAGEIRRIQDILVYTAHAVMFGIGAVVGLKR
jgi:hypothetical protein